MLVIYGVHKLLTFKIFLNQYFLVIFSLQTTLTTEVWPMTQNKFITTKL